MSQSPSWTAPPTRRRFTAGFSLIEILATIVIITIIASMALPMLRRGLRDRRTRLAAEDVARVYRDARLRAMGRGSAVVVSYNESARTFVVREAVAGLSATTPAQCARLPATSCQLADFINNSGTLRGSQAVETLVLDTATETSGLKVQLQLPSSGSAAVPSLSICFTPLGRSFVAPALATPTTSFSLMSEVPIFRVYRTEPGETTRVGLERRVVLLPNGQARLQTAGG